VGTSASSGSGQPIASPSWAQWLQWQWWGLDLAWNRWWLGFDQAGQEALLRRLFGNQRQTLGLVLLVGVMALLSLGFGWLQWSQQPVGPPQRRRQLNRILRQLERHALHPQAGETLDALTMRARAMGLDQAALLQQLATTYNQLEFRALSGQEQRRLEAQWTKLLKALERANRKGL
jgi:hypothetical protein